VGLGGRRCIHTRVCDWFWGWGRAVMRDLFGSDITYWNADMFNEMGERGDSYPARSRMPSTPHPHTGHPPLLPRRSVVQRSGLPDSRQRGGVPGHGRGRSQRRVRHAGLAVPVGVLGPTAGEKPQRRGCDTAHGPPTPSDVGLRCGAQIEAYLAGVPSSRMLILDLFTDSVPVWNRPGLNSYYGKPWVWNMLQVFGGRRGVYGNLPLLSSSIVQSRLAANSTMVGIGTTPEAIDQSPVTFDLLFDMGWRTVSPDVPSWLTQYGQRRYGAASPSITAALSILLNATWTLTYGYGTTQSFCWLEQEPGIVRSDYDGTDADGLAQAFRLFVAAGVNGEVNATLGPYQYDLVDLARQFACNVFGDLDNEMGYEYRQFQWNGRNTSASVVPIYAAMLQLIAQLDTLLATNTNYLLGHWLADAAQWAQSPLDSALLQFNARNQITLWGPRGESLVHLRLHHHPTLSLHPPPPFPFLPSHALFRRPCRGDQRLRRQERLGR